MRYLEYVLETGKIISELTSTQEITPAEGCGLLEIDGDLIIDTNNYIVRNGVLAKSYETEEERRERMRLRQEKMEKNRERARAMFNEFIWAGLDNDQETIKSLQAEFKTIKGLM